MQQRDQQYFKQLLKILKQVAFHQIYMESARKDLCKDQYYDPHTAFKSMDHFKHNRVVPYELYSFFDLHRIQSNTQQCEYIIQSLDKDLTYLDYESFEQLTLPDTDITLKNLAKTRFNHVKIEVGSYSHLTYVKEHSEHCIAMFLEKELNFSRELLFMRQEFCRQWGGDIYTLLQKVFKTGKQTQQKAMSFQSLYCFGREHGHLFNDVEFRAIWRRSKKGRQNLQQKAGLLSLSFQQIQAMVLVSNLNAKAKYALERNIPLKAVQQASKPSYSVSHWNKYEEWKCNEKHLQLEKMQLLRQPQRIHMKYTVTYSESMSDPYFLRGELRNRNRDWCEHVGRMSEKQLAEAYKAMTTNRVLFRE